MADNNKNPRRTIWLSETEPLSHYDIWLSKNKHLNADGEPVSDNNVLRPCDYIFKVWDCGDWHPVVGLNSTAVNKIDTVYNQSYYSTNPNTGHTIESSSYQEFHLPLFTKPEYSPSELFDAGTIGEAILEYVTELEWKNIFEGNAFSLAFKWYIEEGDTNIDLLIDPAEADKLGGIYADEFSTEDMFPDTEENYYYTPSQINNSYNWLALAKYKYNHGTSDYNLYVNAKDIINAITQYQDDNPNEPGITPGGGAVIDPEVIYRSFFNSPTVLKGWRDDPNAAWKPRFVLPGGNLPENRGKFLMLRQDDDATHDWWANHTDDYDDTNTAVIWQSAHDIVIEGTEYTTDNAKKYLSCQNGDFEWEANVGTEYYPIYPIGINYSNLISILPHLSDTSKLYLCSNNNSVSWQPIDTEIYDVLNSLDHLTSKSYVINGCGTLISPDKVFLNGNGEWAEPSGGTTYSEGIGITISNEDNTNYINIDTSDADEGLVLSYDGDDGIKWIDVLEYDDGYGILITDDNVINGVIRNDTETYIASSHISFNCVVEASTDPLKGITMTLDLDSSTNTILYPYSYTEVTIGTKSMPASLNFTLLNLMTFMKGCPVYVLINVPNEPTNVSIDTTNSSGTASVININDAIIEDNSVSYLDISNYTKFLCTLQFGILKVEPLESISLISNP